MCQALAKDVGVVSSLVERSVRAMAAGGAGMEARGGLSNLSTVFFMALRPYLLAQDVHAGQLTLLMKYDGYS